MLTLSLSYWILQTIAMLITCLLIPNLTVSGPIPAFLTVVALAFVNTKVWDAALFFQIPDAPTYQALVLLLANGFIFWVIVKILPGIETKGLLPPILAPVVFTVCSLLVDTYGKDIDWKMVLDQGIALLQQFKGSIQTPDAATPGATAPERVGSLIIHSLTQRA